MPTVADVVAYLQDFAPLDLAGDWDNVGLLLGNSGNEVRSVLTCLTVTPESAQEAIDKHADLIVTHHPILFRPVQRLTSDTAEGRLLLPLLQTGIAVYSGHSAFDNAAGGFNDGLARRLGLIDIQPLKKTTGAGQCKLVVFVPESDLNKVSEAMFAAGAGHIGQYRECSFRLAGTGTFYGSDATNPTVGQKGRREEVSEWRLEVVCPERHLSQIVNAMRKAHSYEEPAFDVYPLATPPSQRGEGRVGKLQHAMPLAAFAKLVGAQLKAPMVQTVGKPEKPVVKVAIACGAGGSFLGDAIKAKADVFITGEVRFHDTLTAQANDIALVLPGHYATERGGVEDLAAMIQRQWPGLSVWPSERENDPLSATHLPVFDLQVTQRNAD